MNTSPQQSHKQPVRAGFIVVIGVFLSLAFAFMAYYYRKELNRQNTQSYTQISATVGSCEARRKSSDICYVSIGNTITTVGVKYIGSYQAGSSITLAQYEDGTIVEDPSYKTPWITPYILGLLSLASVLLTIYFLVRQKSNSKTPS